MRVPGVFPPIGPEPPRARSRALIRLSVQEKSTAQHSAPCLHRGARFKCLSPRPPPPLTCSSVSNGRRGPDITPPADHSRCQSARILSLAAGSLKPLPRSLRTRLLYLPALIMKLLLTKNASATWLTADAP